MNTAEQEISEKVGQGAITKEEGVQLLYEVQQKERETTSQHNRNVKTYAITPSGDTYHHDPKNPAMLPVPRQILLSKFSTIDKYDKTGQRIVRSSISERELKVFFFLLHAVWEELEPGKTHKIDMTKAHKALKSEYGINEKASTWIWESAKNLSRFHIEWIKIENDERWECVGSLINYAETNQAARESGILRFRFCNELVPVLKEQSRFSRVKLHFLMSLASKHAIIIYGILEGYANHDYVNTFTFELGLIRSWLKIEPKQYTNFKDFRVRVLEPAIEQINKNPEGAGFSVSYKPIKRRQKVHAIEITINKTAKRLNLETKLKSKKQKPKQSPNSQTYNKPFNYELLKNTLNKRLRAFSTQRHDVNALIGGYEKEWRKSIFNSPECDTMESPEGCFAGFIIKKEIKARNL